MDKKAIVANGVHNYTLEEDYVEPKEEGVREHIRSYMGKKLGLMMHWSPGSQMSTFESWPLSDGDGTWSQKDITWTDDIEEFKKDYWNANKTFYPLRFRPDKWAEFAEECGFKYLLFTTKHHDGFCMFDTATTDYKITDSSCPFHKNKYADIVGSLFEEFRKRGLSVSAYFSKPDWHSNDYWHKEFGNAPTRNINYKIEEHPALWESFVNYTHKQLEEICTNYGAVDVLWLDGGWVRPDNLGQDIRLGEIVKKLRATTQPNLIVCDRTVGGIYENIVTPEQNTPENVLNIPWESCTTVGNYFSYHYNDRFKSSGELVHLLIDIVCKGGNLALNLAPQPDGEFPHAAMQSLKGMGIWLKLHGEGIYDSVVCAPYFEGNIKYTKKGNIIYAFYLYDQIPSIHKDIILHIEQNVKSISLLRRNEPLLFRQRGNIVTIKAQEIVLDGAMYADCFAIELA